MMTNPATETATPLVRSLRAPGPWTLVDILDGRQLRVQLTAAALEHVGDDAALKARARDLLHGALFRGRLIAQERLEQGADGLDTARLLAAVQDEVLSALYDFTTTHVFRSRNPTEAERLAVFATGGYGRGVLAPSSDIDLLFVRPYKSAAWAESVIEYMLYMLWDMGLKVGHAYRTLDECIRLSKSDVTIKTAFMDARFLFGDEALADDIRARFDREAVKGRDGEFIAAKLAERDARHARQGHTRYVVEPNVKDGKGGLRDLQTLYWIAKHVYGGDTLEDVLGARVFTPHEYKVFLRAARFFWTVRCHLHYLTGRAEERISFDLQPELAKRLGYRDRAGRLGVERFMKRYFVAAKDVGGLTRILAAKLDAEHNKPSPLRRLFPGGAPKPLGPAGFLVDQGRLTVSGPEVFSSDPRNLLRLFGLAVDEGLDVHPDAMIWASRLVKEIRDETRRDPEAGELFMDAVLGGEHPGAALRMMNEAGVLGRFLPEFGGIVAQTQFNMYHYYTVDEHTLRAVEAISDIEHRRGDFPPLASDLFEQIHHRRALYLAMLLHDTGKGQGDQQIEGAKTARAAAERLGLPEAEQDLIAWLVGHHLVMSETAQKRDISDPRTVAGFAETVGSLERLRLLYILTIADITAVGPGVWNGWKGQLLAELYHAAAAALRGGRTDEASVASELDELATRRRAALLERLGAAPAIMFEMEPAYWTGFDLEALAWHAEALSKTDGPVAATRATDANGATMLLASGPDRPGLFADLVGTVAAEGGDVVTAQVFTSDTGRIIDVFAIQDRNGEVFAAGDANRVQRLEAAILNTLRGDAPQPPEETPSGRREAAFLVRPSVTLLASASASNLVIDLEARDRALLLYDVARTLAENGCSIQSAHIGSYGERVFDAFYVQRTDGGQFDDAMKKTLRRRLLDLLARDEPDAPETPARRLARSRAADSF